MKSKNLLIGKVASIIAFLLFTTSPVYPKQEKFSDPSPDHFVNLISKNPSLNLEPFWEKWKIIPFGGSGINLEAKLSKVKFNGESTQKIVVKISDVLGKAYRYLIFKQNHEAKKLWKLMGFVDSKNQYEAPQYRFVTTENAAWFVLQELTGSGSGVLSYQDVWYLIDESGGELKKVLSYPVKGYDLGEGGDPLSRFFKAKIIKERPTLDGFEVELEFSVTYKLIDSKPLFTKRQKAVYLWTVGSNHFLLNRNRSQISKEEIENVFNFDTLSDEDFLKYNLKELLAIASERNQNKKEQLREFLDRLKETPQKKVLQQALH